MIVAKGITAMAARLASGQVRTAGKIEFIRDQGPLRRDVRTQGFEWNGDVLRDMAKVLWASERAHGYAMSALRIFSRLPSSKFSPDGLLGGRGYIREIRDMRSSLGQSVETLSSFTDTVHDEINAPHWATAGQDSEIEGIVQDAEEVKANPERFVEDQYQSDVAEPEALENPSADDYNPFFERGEEEEDDSDWSWDSIQTSISSDLDRQLDLVASDPDFVLVSSITDITEDKEIPLPGPRAELPTDEKDQKEGLSGIEMHMNTTGENPRGNYAGALAKDLAKQGIVAASRRIADSSVAPETLPGPRVMHVGPGESPEEFGYFSDEGNERPSDDPLGEGFSHLDRIVEDVVADGVTGYTDATQGDETVFKQSAARLAGSRLAEFYSWLPGSSNEKNLNYYELGLSDEDVEWMRSNNKPDAPPGLTPEPMRPPTEGLWDLVRS